MFLKEYTTDSDNINNIIIERENSLDFGIYALVETEPYKIIWLIRKHLRSALLLLHLLLQYRNSLD